MTIIWQETKPHPFSKEGRALREQQKAQQSEQTQEVSKSDTPNL